MSSKVLKAQTLTELHEIFNAHDKVVVDFAAPAWCVPCRRLAPHIESAAKNSEDTVFVEVDIDHADEISKAYQIQAVPTVLLFKRGEETQPVKGRTVKQILDEIK